MTRPRAADGCSLKPLIWTGDLNACHREVDVSHPAFFANQKAEGKSGKAPVALPADPDDRGQPGFTRTSGGGSTIWSKTRGWWTPTASCTATPRCA